MDANLIKELYDEVNDKEKKCYVEINELMNVIYKGRFTVAAFRNLNYEEKLFRYILPISFSSKVPEDEFERYIQSFIEYNGVAGINYDAISKSIIQMKIKKDTINAFNSSFKFATKSLFEIYGDGTKTIENTLEKQYNIKEYDSKYSILNMTVGLATTLYFCSNTTLEYFIKNLFRQAVKDSTEDEKCYFKLINIDKKCTFDSKPIEEIYLYSFIDKLN